MTERIAPNLDLKAEDFELPPFGKRGRQGAGHRFVGVALPIVLTSRNDAVAA